MPVIGRYHQVVATPREAVELESRITAELAEVAAGTMPRTVTRSSCCYDVEIERVPAWWHRRTRRADPSRMSVSFRRSRTTEGVSVTAEFSVPGAPDPEPTSDGVRNAGR